MYITSHSIRIALLSRYVNIYDTMAPMSTQHDRGVRLLCDVPPSDLRRIGISIESGRILGINPVLLVVVNALIDFLTEMDQM